MVSKMENPYTVLGIPKDASPEQVKKAYFSLIRKHPPEKDPGGFKRVRLAYDSLQDADKRSQTDLFLFNDPYGDFNVRAPEGHEHLKLSFQRRKFDQRKPKDISALEDIDLKIFIYSLSDLSRTDFSDEFNDIDEGLD
jgi:curved DNA-binding protein CbpA